MFTSNYELMTQSHIDYFQFAYGGASESDGTSRKSSVKSEEKEEIKAMGTPLDPSKFELIKAISEENILEFTSTLKSIPLGNKSLASQTVDEAMGLFNARFQHVYELKNELEAIGNERKMVGNPLKLDLNLSNNRNQPQGELLMTCTTEKAAGCLYEALITCLERLVEHGITTNVQLALVFEVLTSYPQPVLETLVLYSDVMNTPFLPRIVRVL
uniref:CCR4-NOT transcription complex subunit 11 n=2 Tax=Bursaphelenchus xylophilus TaxID=6326 RepID=A0A1I7S6J5_BURXY